MKNNFILFCIAITTAFSFTSCKNSNGSALDTKDTVLLKKEDQSLKLGNKELEYYYGVHPRFAPISKTDLDNAKTVYPFNNDDENKRIAKINSTEIIIIKKDRRTNRREYGDSKELTKVQKELFKSLDYGKHFSMKTLFLEKSEDGKLLEEKKYNPHYTVVPETQANYTAGKEALINYLKETIKAQTFNLDNKKLSSNKVYFTISKKGLIENVSMHFSTNYPELDAKLKEAIINLPGQWLPAKNNKGETIEQELTFTFGPKGGC